MISAPSAKQKDSWLTSVPLQTQRSHVLLCAIHTYVQQVLESGRRGTARGGGS